MITGFATVSAASAVALLALHAITLRIGHRIGRYNVVDVAWGLGFLVVATVGAALMTYFLVHATGARLTEKYMRGRPGFGEYQQRTSFFIPRRPGSARS